MQTLTLWTLVRDCLGSMQEADKVGKQGGVKYLINAGKAMSS